MSDDARRAFPGTATRAELEARYRARRKANPAPTLTPPGHTQTPVDRSVDQANEKRVAYLENRLGQAAESLSRGRDAFTAPCSPKPLKGAFHEQA